MALKLLNPGLRPLGMFDLEDDDAGLVVGGQYVELLQATAGEGYAADVPAGPLSAGNTTLFTRVTRTAGNFGGLADEGEDEYGTLFGSLIGQNAGRSTQVGTVNGAVVLGPSTDRASGKVTVWATPGLYGVNEQDATLDGATATANAIVTSDANGLLEIDAAAATNIVGIYVGAVTDSSLVSTTAAAAGETSGVEYHAVFYLGNAQV